MAGGADRRPDRGARQAERRAVIRSLIAGEPPGRPLSDDRLVTLLSGEGIGIARRTVAKYREGMGILSSVERRRLKANLIRA